MRNNGVVVCTIVIVQRLQLLTYRRVATGMFIPSFAFLRIPQEDYLACHNEMKEGLQSYGDLTQQCYDDETLCPEPDAI